MVKTATKTTQLVTTIQAWGNSTGVRIPKTIIDQTKGFLGKEVEIYADGERIVIAPKRLSFKERCAKIRPETMHENMDWAPVGRELL